MGAIIKRARRFRRARHFTSITALVLLNLQFINAIVPGLGFVGARYLCAPAFFCHSCPWAVMACPIGVLVNFSTLRVFPFIAVGTLALIGTLGGRIICGWVCPFGWLQDLLHRIPTRKFDTPRVLRYTKYLLLVVTVFAIPFFLPGARYTFCHGCPAGTLEGLYPYGFLAGWDTSTGLFAGFTLRFFLRSGILLGVLMLAVFASRGFCRVLCPLGAIFGLFNRFSLFRFNLTHHKCSGCGACAKVCPVDMDPVNEMNGAECIRCYECTTTKHIRMGVR